MLPCTKELNNTFKPQGFNMYLMHDDPVLIELRFYYFIYLSEKL